MSALTLHPVGRSEADPTPPDEARPAVAGTTSIADRVIAKIAAEAANEVEHTAGYRYRLAGLRSSSDRPKATAVVDGRWARVAVDVAVDYPTSLRTITRQVRARIVDQVGALADVEVKEVDVQIVALLVADVHERRVR